MYFRILGNAVEYQQAAKRLEQIADANPDSAEGQEYKLLLKAFLKYERDLKLARKNFLVKTPGSNPA